MGNRQFFTSHTTFNKAEAFYTRGLMNTKYVIFRKVEILQNI